MRTLPRRTFLRGALISLSMAVMTTKCMLLHLPISMTPTMIAGYGLIPPFHRLTTTPPLARSFHTATFVNVDNEPYLFVVGGLHMRADRHSRDRNWAPPELCVFNLRTNKWYPSLNVLSRYGHAAVLLPGDKPRILILGGRDARGKHSSMHYIIDVVAVLECLKVHDEPLISSIEQLAMTDEMYSMPSAPWRSLGPFSDSIGPFNGTSNLWADRCGHTIYVLGQSTGDTRVPVDLFPHATNQTLPYSVWALKFDSGWTSFEDISSHALPLSTATSTAADGERDGAERWMWFGILDSHLKVAQGDSAGEIDWNEIASEPVFLALNAARKNSHEEPVEGGPKDTIRSLTVPLLSLPSSNVRGTTQRDHISERTGSAMSFARYVPLVWEASHEDLSAHQSGGSIKQSNCFPEPDFAVETSDTSNPPIMAHSLVLGSRSSYFHMLLTSGFGAKHSTHSTASNTNSVHDLPSHSNPPPRYRTLIDEKYLVTYTLVYFLYCDELPSFLASPSAHYAQSPRSHQSSSPPSPDPPIQSSPQLSCDPSNLKQLQIAQIAADVLIAADKYLFPPRLSHLIRRNIMENHIHASPLTALNIWRAAYLTRNSLGIQTGSTLVMKPAETTQSSSAFLPNQHPMHTSHNGPNRTNTLAYGTNESMSPIALPDLVPVRRDEETWLERVVREAYEHKYLHSTDSPARLFLAEVSRWCARRAHEIEADLSALQDAGADASGPIPIEAEVIDAFWEEMARLGAVSPPPIVADSDDEDLESELDS